MKYENTSHGLLGFPFVFPSYIGIFECNLVGTDSQQVLCNIGSLVNLDKSYIVKVAKKENFV